MSTRCWWLAAVLFATSGIISGVYSPSVCAQEKVAADDDGEELPEEFQLGELTPGYERAAAKDPGFSPYVDFSLLGRAMDENDSSLLADVALRAAEGERVLQRAHHSGITADLLVLRAARLAGRNQDKDSLDRLVSGARALEKTGWVDQVTSIAKLSESKRGIVGSVDIDKLDEKSRNVVVMLEIAVRAAETTGSREPLLALQKATDDAEIHADVKKMVAASIKDTLESLPEQNQEVDDLLQELAAGSRGFKIGGVTISGPKISKPSLPKLTPRYVTNKFDLKARVESGGWVVAWSDDISETDVAKGVAAAGVSIYAANPAPFLKWIDSLITRTINSLAASARKRFSGALLSKAKQATADVMKAAIQGKSAKEVARRYDTVDFKAGAIRYSGANMVGDTTISRTWGMKPYVAFRIR